MTEFESRNYKTTIKRHVMFEKGNKFGNRFSSTCQPKKNGRKPRLYTIARKSYGIDVGEFRDVVLYLMQCTKKDLETVMNDDNTPVWVINIAQAIRKDMGIGRLSVLPELLDRVFGKPSQAVDVTSNGGPIVPVPEPITIEIIDSRDQIDDDL